MFEYLVPFPFPTLVENSLAEEVGNHVNYMDLLSVKADLWFCLPDAVTPSLGHFSLLASS